MMFDSIVQRICKKHTTTYEIKGTAVATIGQLKEYKDELGTICPRDVRQDLHFNVLQALVDLYDDVDDNVASGNYELTVARDRIIVTEIN